MKKGIKVGVIPDKRQFIVVKCKTCKKPRKVFSSNVSLYLTKDCKECYIKNLLLRNKSVKDYFTVIDSETKAYIFGFLWADGSVFANGVRAKVHIKDKEVCEMIKNEIGGQIYNHNYKDYYYCQWQLSSTQVAKNILSLNYRKNLDFVPKKYIYDFVRGFIDGDGNYYINPELHTFNITLSSNYNQDWNFLTNLNIFPSFRINKIKNKKIINGKVQSSSRLRILGKMTDKIDFCNKLYYSKPYLERKHNYINTNLNNWEKYANRYSA